MMKRRTPYQYKRPLPVKDIVEPRLSSDELMGIETRSQLIELLKGRGEKSNQALDMFYHDQEQRLLQIELIKLQQWIIKNNNRVAILFEGRDAAGKGGTIKRFMEHLNPRTIRKVALP